MKTSAVVVSIAITLVLAITGGCTSKVASVVDQGKGEESGKIEKQKTEMTTFVAQDKNYQVLAPNDWAYMTGELNDDADLEIANAIKEKYVMALVENKQDLDFTFDEYYKYVTEGLLSVYTNVEVVEEKPITVNGHNGKEMKFYGTAEGVNVYFAVHILETETDYIQLWGWTIKSKMEKVMPEILSVMGSFDIVK